MSAMDQLGRLLAFLLVLTSSAASQAALITWEVKARISVIDPPMVGYASLGDVISYRLTFDDATPDAEPEVAERGKFEGAIVASSLSLGSQTASDGNKAGYYITIVNDFTSPARDQFIAANMDTGWSVPLDPFNGYSFGGVGMHFKDVEALMLSDTALHAEPNFAGYDEFLLNLAFLKPIALNTYLGAAIRSDSLVSIERVVPVPVPGTAWLLGGVLLALGAYRRAAGAGAYHGSV